MDRTNPVVVVVILPFLVFFLLYVSIYLYNKNAGRSFFIGILTWSALLLFFSEWLSLFHALTYFWSAITWSITALGLALFLFWRRKKIDLSFISLSLKKIQIKEITKKEIFLISTIIFFITVIGILAVVAPPNSYDATYYHLTRLFFWAQYQSISFYPANSLPQIVHPPLMEIINLNYYLLNGNDRFVNISQSISMAACVIAVAMMTKQIHPKSNRIATLLASVFCVSLPQGILQASNGKNDYVASLYFLCAIYFLILYYQYEDNKSSHAIFLGLASGLAILTKATLYFYIFPFLLFFGYLSWRRKELVKNFLWSALFFLLINATHWLRNFSLLGTPLPSDDGLSNHLPEGIGMASFFSSFLKNLSLHFQTPHRPTNNRIEGFIQGIHDFFGLDINNTQWSQHNFDIPDTILHQVYAGNPFHIALLLFILVLSLYYLFKNKFTFFYKKDLRISFAIVYSVCLFIGFSLFCLLIKWQVVGARYHLPLFVAVSPLIAFVANGYKTRFFRNSIFGIMTMLLFSSSPQLIINLSRPIIEKVPKKYEKYLGRFQESLPKHSIFSMDRKDMYFLDFGIHKRKDYERAAQFVQDTHCKTVAILATKLAPLYPLLVFLKIKEATLRVQHIGIQNKTISLASTAPFHNFSPCLIVFLGHHSIADRLEKERDKLQQNWQRKNSLFHAESFIQIWEKIQKP